MPEPRGDRRRVRAVVVAGMHRSGTSMVGGMLASLGVDMGQRLIPADRRNARGYFEDADIVEFHGQLFRALLPADAAGHVDWGWCEQAPLDESGLAAFVPQARALVEARAAAEGTWGFKDPRTTVLLDLWDGCIEDARYVMVYRFPWQVADSMQRLGAGVFLRNPSYAYRVWAHYNARMLDFLERNRERCVLVSTDELPRHLPLFRRLLDERLGLELQDVDLAQGFDPGLFQAAEAGDPRADLTAAAYPDCMRLLERLEAAADIPSDGSWRPRSTAAPAPDPDGADVDVSIVVPVHDDAVLLLDALASVARCRPPASELIVVDDGSRDAETLRILDALRDRGYRILAKPNGGLSSARNFGIERARGRYVLPLDADNRMRPGFVEAAVEALEGDPGLGVVYGDRRLFGALDEVDHVPPFDQRSLLGGSRIDACALFRRELWSDVGGYDTAMRGLEDWEFWLHASRRGWRFLHLDRVAFDYRLRPDSLLAWSLSPSTRRALTGHILRKHVDVFHEALPAPLRLASQGLGWLLPGPARARLRTGFALLFWRPLWTLIGPGGWLAADRRVRRALADEA